MTLHVLAQLRPRSAFSVIFGLHEKVEGAHCPVTGRQSRSAGLLILGVAISRTIKLRFKVTMGHCLRIRPSLAAFHRG